MNNKKIKILSIVGPTATGKTKLSISIAKKFSGEIISADSMQVYKEFNILSAKPKIDEMKNIKHHLLDFLSVEKDYNVAQFTKEAKKCIFDIYSNDKLPILVGGTGLYIDSLIKDIDFSSPKNKIDIKFADSNEELLSILKRIDPESANKIHLNDTKRLKRAIEFFYTMGYPISEHIKNSKKIISPYEVCMIGLNYINRETLYEKINSRVDNMINQGLFEEVENIMKNKSLSKTAKSAIGYKEIEEYFSGLVDYDLACENVKKFSRRYAKRQLTWFRRNENINWIYIDKYENFSDVINQATTIIKKFLHNECLYNEKIKKEN